MTSSTKINIPSRATQAEIDALVNIPAGSSIFNTTTGVMNIALTGGGAPIWNVPASNGDSASFDDITSYSGSGFLTQINSAGLKVRDNPQTQSVAVTDSTIVVSGANNAIAIDETLGIEIVNVPLSKITSVTPDSLLLANYPTTDSSLVKFDELAVRDSPQTQFTSVKKNLVQLSDASSNILNITATGFSGNTINVATTELLRNGGNFFDGVSPNTTKGDLTVRGTTTNVRLPVGTNFQTLQANSAATNGVEWANTPQRTHVYADKFGFANILLTSGGAQTIELFPNEILDPSGSFNTSIFTAPSNGVYKFDYSVQSETALSPGAQTFEMVTSFYVGGVQYHQIDTKKMSLPNNRLISTQNAGSILISLIAGQAVFVLARNNGTIDATITSTNFSAELIAYT